MDKLHAQPCWHQLRADFFADGEPAPVLAGLSKTVEDAAIQAFRQTLAPAGEISMLAVGGFGRRELFPYSDVDILILVEKEAQAAEIKSPLSEFVRLVWDSGLRLSHSVRTTAECLEVNEQNIELSISLLDRRLLDGSAELYGKLEAKFPAFIERQARVLTRHLCQMTRTRHSKFQRTFYHLEPDLKESPGGLRDLHFIEWLGKLRHSVADVQERLSPPRFFFQALRCWLHYQAGRDQNLLSFETQHELAQQGFMKFGAPAEFMREYFRNARGIYNEVRRALDLHERRDSSLLSNFRDWRSRLSNADFTVSNERVLLRAPAQLESDPELFFRLFEFVARHSLPLAAETERRLEGGRDAFARFCESGKPLWPVLRRILSLPRAALGLRAMHDTGILQALFPEWNTITCLVIPDYYHRYTVDEHTLVAIEKLGELAEAAEPSRKRLAGVLSEIADPALLRFALLFHDVGKGSGEDHSVRSVELARIAMRRIQMPVADQSTVEFLIEHHLDVSAVMNTRDLHNPTTARILAERIGTLERLKLLVVLTYADISAVNPAAMTPWRLEQLWQAYLVTHQVLVRELETERIQNVPPTAPEGSDFIRGFPVRYLRTHTPDEILAHAELHEFSRPTGVAVQLERWSGVYRAMIVAPDMPGLFAALAGAISSFGMDIVKAEAFANTRGQILDTFVFADPKRTLELNPQENERLQHTLEEVAAGKLDPAKLLDGRPAPRHKLRTVKPQVHFDSQACETATLVEIIAEDRPRLLYDLASAFSSAGCNIDVVLIDTEGHRAIDVFYVACDGAKLTAPVQALVQQKLLAVC